ncbi:MULTISPECIES: hypothetical protein [unclassified Lysobacter]|uniref:hypothetical protein n=1 Tax=unclassified Lysobacter TaxID=2635362 RepID=UPI001BE794AF|nr:MULTISPECIES: hypothetical protein [unclassified Lysobacter]MBT2746219.1 hypothetical protein [Lysobacter sp. ISL-42]MBT2750764.1 hypothetical protein [Lysobacter sp. ISL-50]MBT2776089.1 hypothetical protein [Lysobacter sp. ISL-54]MBT2784595.1 hypothetical protein [Lysobacter sp. ISL-52]
MAETVHIAQMAEKISDELFAEFFWKKIGPTNQNWPCEDQDHHNVKTHPSDVVFFYDEPYSQARTYVNCDLKSYAKDSISTSAVRSALESLGKQVACAEKSDEWRKLYIHDDVTPQISGLLFVYNHDGEYDKNFDTVIVSLKNEALDLPRGSKIVVLGPKDIFWLDNVRYEIRQMRGSSGPDQLPAADKCRYFYPQLVLKANVQLEKAKSATLEMLTAPWIVLEYERPQSQARGIVVFYRRDGSTTQEFMYLIDYLRHYQVLEESARVHVKVLDVVPTAQVNFQKAVHQYIAEVANGDMGSKLAQCVEAIKFSRITQVLTTFSSIELGMGYE